MLQQLDTEKAQAVMFFGKEGIVKELLYTEFQALLDGYVPICEWENQTHRAVYVEFNSEYLAVATVFFTLTFDDNGKVEASWNLPLVDMARTVSKGPNLGAGPVHLACRSMCPVEYFKDWLWDPDMKSAKGHFGLLKQAIKRNKLGVQFKSTEEEHTASSGWSAKDAALLEKRLSQQFSKQYGNNMQAQLAQLQSDQALRVATMESEKEAALAELHKKYAQKIEMLQQSIEEKQVALDDASQRNHTLKDTIDSQVQKIEGLRDYFEHKVRRSKGVDSEALDSMSKQYKVELEAKVQAATGELKDLLKMKEVELNLRMEHEDSIKVELDRLREANKDLVSNSGDQLLEKLSRKGINFVTYQPGAGHITVPLSEISRFIDNPNAFTADYCGVSEKHYLSWLKHYQTPVCSAMDANGEMCCEDIARVVNPAEYVLGESDCCEEHNRLKTSSSQVS